LRSTIKVLAFVNQNANIDDLSNLVKELVYLKSYSELKERLDSIDYAYPHIVLVDIDYILEQKHISWLDIKHDLMYKNTSIAIYGEDISFDVKQKLYSLDIKGIIDINTNNQKNIFLHLARKTNLYSSSLKNNLIRAMIIYNDLEDVSKESTYLLDYLIYFYELTYTDASNIRLALIFLLMAIKKNHTYKIENFIHVAFKLKDVDRLYKNYKAPKLLDEKILSLILKLNADKDVIGYTKDIDTSDIDSDFIAEVESFNKSKVKVIASYQDMNFFLEQLYSTILQNCKKEDCLSTNLFLSYINDILLTVLGYTNYFLADTNSFESEEIVVNIKFNSSVNGDFKEYLDSISNSSDMINMVLDENGNYTISITNIDKSSIGYDIINTKKSKIDKSKINFMHYENDEKISATEFLKSFSVDYGMIDELNDDTKEITTLLYQELKLSQETIDAIVIILQRYSSVLNETLEFKDIADSLISLAMVLKELHIEDMGDEKREKLGFYIQGIIDDLNSWKNYIFVTAKTPDIHYLDASLLENCLEIEKFILSDSSDEENVDEENDDLEFF